jgi:hypothetical protein
MKSDTETLSMTAAHRLHPFSRMLRTVRIDFGLDDVPAGGNAASALRGKRVSSPSTAQVPG